MQIPELSLDLVRSEIANGRLALRVTALVVTVSFLLLLLRATREFGYENPDPGKALPAANAYIDHYLGRGIWPLRRVVRRSAVLMMVLASLCVFAAASRTSLAISLLNWSMVFVVDDFAMAANYRHAYLLPPPRFDRFKVSIGVYATLGLFCFVLTQQFAAWIAWSLIALIALALFVIPGLIHAARWSAAFLATVGIYDYDEAEVARYEDLKSRARESLEFLLDNKLISKAEFNVKAQIVDLRWPTELMMIEIDKDEGTLRIIQ